MRYDDIIQLLPGLCALRHYSVTAGAVCVTTFFNPSRGCVRFNIFQSLQGLCALRRHSNSSITAGLCALRRHYSVTAGAVCVTTLFNPSRGCVLYDDITLSLQGLCALQRHSSAIVSCYEGTCQPSLVPVTVPVPATFFSYCKLL